MSQLLTDDLGDLEVTNNNFSVIRGDREIEQSLLQNLKTFEGEWFLNTTLGVPYFQIVFQKQSPPSLIADAFKDTILETNGVTELSRFVPLDLSPDRELSVEFSVNGNIDIEASLP